MRVEKRLRRWGNAYGVAISGKEVKRLGLSVDEPVRVEISRIAATVDLASLPTFEGNAPDDLDQVLEEEAVAGR